MIGVVAQTDFDWFIFLQNEGPLEEVNFWQPHPIRPRIEPGTPWFFHLKSPHYMIGGFGFFARWMSMPVRLAWDTFGRMNGAPDSISLTSRIAHYSGAGEGLKTADRINIGCVMLSQPIFFSQSDWVVDPVDWKRQGIVRWKTYDIDQGEGRRLFDECRAIAARYHVKADSRIVAPQLPVNRYGDPVLVRPRLGQGTFRAAVIQAYNGACAVTSEHSLPALEAAHIQPFGDEGTHDVSNGLLLRADIHNLYDHGYVTVTADHRFRVSPALKDDYSNGRSYYPLDGKKIYVPKTVADQPNLRFLQWHADSVFRSR